MVPDSSVREEPEDAGDRACACPAALWCGTVLAVLTIACGGSDLRPHVLLISIDTLRADHLAAYGYSRETAPSLTRLAAEGARFANAYAQAPSTVPTHASLFTGRFPFQHGSYHVGLPVEASEVTLAEALRSAGYQTFAIASSVRFRGRTGFDQGYESYEVLDGVEDGIRSALVTDRALAWLTRAGDDTPWFGFLHYFDPHNPYSPPDAYRTLWHEGLSQPEPEQTTKYIFFHRDAEHTVPPDVLDWMRALYDGEIRHLDVHLERLFDGLRRPRGRPVLVVVTSDHGEEFKEHGGLAHAGGRLHEELLRVPLFVWWPGRVQAGLVIEAPAQTVDVMPTLLELAGVAAPPGLVGESRAEALLGATTPAAEHTIVAEAGPNRWAVTADLAAGRFKLVSNEGAQRLYDLGADPGGHIDVVAERPQEREALETIANDVGLTRAAHTRTPESVPESVAEALRAIGYVEEAEAAAPTPDSGRAP